MAGNTLAELLAVPTLCVSGLLIAITSRTVPAPAAYLIIFLFTKFIKSAHCTSKLDASSSANYQRIFVLGIVQTVGAMRLCKIRHL